MALGFLMNDSIYILQPSGERDALGAERAVFVRGDRIQCGWGRFSSVSGDTHLGQEARGLCLAIVPPLDQEPAWVEHRGKLYQVREIRRFAGFSTDHWELALEEYAGRFEIR